jgi:hypothetical protein
MPLLQQAKHERRKHEHDAKLAAIKKQNEANRVGVDEFKNPFSRRISIEIRQLSEVSVYMLLVGKWNLNSLLNYMHVDRTADTSALELVMGTLHVHYACVRNWCEGEGSGVVTVPSVIN